MHALKLDEGPHHHLAGNFHHVRCLATALTRLDGLRLVLLADQHSYQPLMDSGLKCQIIGCKLREPRVLTADEAVHQWVNRIQPDIYHRPTGQLPFRQLPCKTVAGVADLNFVMRPTRLAVRLYKELSYRWTLNIADCVVCVSEYTRSEVVRYFEPNGTRLRVVRHGAGNLPPIEDIGLNLDAGYWLTFGHQPHKNVESCIKMMELRRQRRDRQKDHLVVVGRSRHLEEVIMPMVRQRGLGDIVHFVGKVSDGQLHGLYRSAKGLLFLSKYEGFGLPVLEAMSVGCPVITSDVCSLPEVAGGASLMTPPDDVSQIAEHCSAIESSSEFRSDLVNKGYLRANSLTWHAAAVSVSAIYDELMRDRSVVL